MAMPITIGKAAETDEVVEIDSIARTSGLYVLGKPGMGKSNLLLHLMLRDTSNNYGLFFLDPHGDAIQDFIKHTYMLILFEAKDVWILDPENGHYSFGINPLYCRDLTSLRSCLAKKLIRLQALSNRYLQHSQTNYVFSR